MQDTEVKIHCYVIKARVLFLITKNVLYEIAIILIKEDKLI